MIKLVLNYTKSNYSIVIVLALFAILQLPFLSISRPIMVDESWYSNSSYNFITSGSFENVNIGFGGNGVIVFLLYLSSYFLLFGTSLFTARLSSFVMGVLAIFLVRKILEILKADEFNKLIALSFFAFANLYLSIFKFSRPEALALVFSLLVLISVYNYLNKNYSLKYLFFMVFLSFLSINSHPNSAIIVLLSFFVILYYIIKNKNYSKLLHLVPIAAGGAVSILFMIVVISINNNFSLNDSVNNLFGRNSVNNYFLVKLLSKINVTKEYFILTNKIITFLPQVFVLAAGLFFVKKNKDLFYISLCGLVSAGIAFIFLAPSGFIYVYPYIFIFSIPALSLLLITLDKNKILGKTITVLSVIVILFNIVAYISLTKKTMDFEINKRMSEINLLLPENSLILSEPPFWFISPEKNIKTLRYLDEKKIRLSGLDFFVIDCDKFRNDSKENPNAIMYLNEYISNYTADTIFVKPNKIYGNVYLIKYKQK